MMIAAGVTAKSLSTYSVTPRSRARSTSPDELPSIYHLKEYNAGRTQKAPDYRLTCFFVDRN